MRAKNLFRTLWILALLNLSAFVAFSQLDLNEPTAGLRLRSEHDGLIVFGQNALGLYRFKHFSNWTQLEAYLTLKQLELQPINDVPVKQNWEAERVANKLLWRNNGEDAVLQTPDKQSAQKLLPHIRYQNLEMSILGFAVPLKPRVLAR